MAEATVTRQPFEALEVANRVRSKRAALKRELRSLPRPEALRRAAVLLIDPPAYLATMTVLDLLLAVRRNGRQRATEQLRTAGVSHIRQLADLTTRQRMVLARELGARASA